MKIALCLFGNVGHKEGQGIRKKKAGHDPFQEAFRPKNQWTNPAVAKNGFDQALAGHQVDTFIHSWSVDFADELDNIYKPKKWEIVEQQKFEPNIDDYGLIGNNMADWKISDSARKSYELLLPSRGSAAVIRTELQELAFRIESRWWSNKRVIELKAAQENEFGFKYDFVLISRIDNVFRANIPFKTLNHTKFYGSGRAGRPDEAYALFDYWFVANSPNMDLFGTLYDNRHKYSVRPTFACREHAEKTIGGDAVGFLFTHDREYRLAREI